MSPNLNYPPVSSLQASQLIDAAQDADWRKFLWLRPGPSLTRYEQAWTYALTCNGDAYAEDRLEPEGRDLNDLCRQIEAGGWDAPFEQLRACLFFVQRSHKWLGGSADCEPKLEELEAKYMACYQSACRAWEREAAENREAIMSAYAEMKRIFAGDENPHHSRAATGNLISDRFDSETDVSGQSIKLFLVDGSPTGLITAEIGQWTGKAIVASRQHLDKLAKRDEAQRTGIYILSGPDPEREGVERVYVGEGEGVLSRIKSHDQNKEFWKRVCIFTATDENLTKSHIKYLESRLVEMARLAGRSSIDNGNIPPRSGLPESEQSDMEMFLGRMQVLLPVLGFQFLEPSAAKKLAENPEAGSPVFEISAVGAYATAQEIEGEFVVKKGSTARIEGAPSWKGGKSNRDRLVKEGVLQICPDSTDHYIFTEDCSFTSPSLAAAAVVGRNTNGRLEWKVKGGNKTYADWQESEANDS